MAGAYEAVAEPTLEAKADDADEDKVEEAKDDADELRLLLG
jgi:hypothetical protein